MAIIANRSIITDQYCNDIRITHAVLYPMNADTIIASDDTSNVRLHFGLKGNYSFSFKQLNSSFDLIGGHHNLMYSKNFDIVVQPRSAKIETFGIQFPKTQFLQITQYAGDRLKRFSEKILNDESVIFSPCWGTLNSRIEHIINEIINHGYNDEFKNIFLLSKCLDLLVLSSESYTVAQNKKETFIKTKTDKEKISAVRDLINERLFQENSLKAIAREAGLNEYKLKRGFKEIFNMTVFEYIKCQRLNMAYEYLKDNEKTSAEIAYMTGYKTPQHFNNSFKKQFGFTPNLVRVNPLKAI